MSNTTGTDVDKIWVVTASQASTRDGEREVVEKQFTVDKVAEELNKFLSKLEKILQDTPQQVSQYQLDEIEIAGEISTNGTIKLFGTGVETGMSGGLKFLFKRKTLNPDEPVRG